MDSWMKQVGLACFLTLGLAVGNFASAETAIIVNPANNSAIDDNLIKMIYLGRAKKFADGSKVVPFDRKEGSTIREGFLSTIVNKQESQMKAHWSRLVFTGNGTPPKSMDSDQAMKEAVASEVGAIGYIDAAAVDGSVKVVKSF